MNQIVEVLSEKVHDAWWAEKEKQGFHPPIECPSKQHQHFQQSPEIGKERFEDAGFNEKTYNWCEKCHTDMYSYKELPENVKEYDRVTVRAVIKALAEAADIF